jgi:hypothetical protein
MLASNASRTVFAMKRLVVLLLSSRVSPRSLVRYPI